MIQVKKIIYTPADIIAMFAVPQTVLAAPASGFVNNILAISHDMVFNANAYTVASGFIYKAIVGDPNIIFIDNDILNESIDINHPVLKITSNFSAYSTIKAFKVTTNDLAATGDSDVTAYIVYETVQLD